MLIPLLWDSFFATQMTFLTELITFNTFYYSVILVYQEGRVWIRTKMIGHSVNILNHL